MYDIIGRLKSFTDNKYDKQLWQRSFHDHIIRNEKDYLKIWNYSDINPQKWNDLFFLPIDKPIGIFYNVFINIYLLGDYKNEL